MARERVQGTGEPDARPSSVGLATVRPKQPVGRGARAEEFLFHLHRGSELLIAGENVGAKEELERALALQPLDPKSEDLLGVVYFRLGLYERALDIYQKLTREHPDAPTLHVNLALGYLKTGQLVRARTSIERAIAIDPGHVRAHAYHGLVLSRLGELDLARAAFERGGHPAMARRMARLSRQSAGGRVDPDQLARDEARSRDLRSVAESAFQELDEVDNPFRVELGGQRPALVGEWQRLGPEAQATAARRDAPEPTAASPAPPQEPAPVGLADGLLAAALPFPETETFAVDGDGTLRVRVGGAVLCRLWGLRVMVGELRTDPVVRRTRGRPTEGVLGPDHAGLHRVSGEGGLVLAPGQGERFETFRIENDPVYLREELLVAIDGNVSWDNGRLPAGARNVPLVNLRGRGDFVAATRGKWRAVAVARTKPALVAVDALLGWSGRLLPSGTATTEGGLPDGLVRFQGDGVLLVAG